jgi:hypothetical protein
MPKKKAKQAKKTKQSVFSKPILLKEQEDFHRKHPQANNLIAVFIIFVVILAWLYFSRLGVMMPKY